MWVPIHSTLCLLKAWRVSPVEDMLANSFQFLLWRNWAGVGQGATWPPGSGGRVSVAGETTHSPRKGHAGVTGAGMQGMGRAEGVGSSSMSSTPRGLDRLALSVEPRRFLPPLANPCWGCRSPQYLPSSQFSATTSLPHQLPWMRSQQPPLPTPSTLVAPEML